MQYWLGEHLLEVYSVHQYGKITDAHQIIMMIEHHQYIRNGCDDFPLSTSTSLEMREPSECTTSTNCEKVQKLPQTFDLYHLHCALGHLHTGTLQLTTANIMREKIATKEGNECVLMAGWALIRSVKCASAW